MYKIGLYFAVFIISNNAQQSSIGRCGTVKQIKEYNGDMILGTWYGYEMSENIKSKLNCLEIQFTKTDKNSNVTMKESTRNNNQLKVKEVTLVQNKNTSQYIEYITSAATRATNIIETDYDSFAIFYQCQDLYAVHKSNVIILTRMRNPDEAIIKKARDAAVKNKLKIKKNSYKINQNNCIA